MRRTGRPALTTNPTATDLAFACTCGTVTGHLTGATSGGGLHLACHCTSCRVAELALGQPDPRPGPVGLFLTTPDRVVLHSGADRLAVLKLGPRSSTWRWYASCCNAPLGNTGPRPGFPFASICTARISDSAALGPVRSEAFVPQPGGGTKHRHIGRFAVHLLKGALATRLSGRWKDTPFFDAATGSPKGPVRSLSAAERAALPQSG
jgi:hypothetical protein